MNPAQTINNHMDQIEQHLERLHKLTAKTHQIRKHVEASGGDVSGLDELHGHIKKALDAHPDAHMAARSGDLLHESVSEMGKLAYQDAKAELNKRHANQLRPVVSALQMAKQTGTESDVKKHTMTLSMMKNDQSAEHKNLHSKHHPMAGSQSAFDKHSADIKSGRHVFN